MHWDSWASIVEDCVRTCSTPTLLIFENIDVVESPMNIESLKLPEDIMDEYIGLAHKPSRLAKAGRIDLKQKKTKDILIEGSENFRTDSDPHVASISSESTTKSYLKSSSKTGSQYGVSSHSSYVSKPKEDNWSCAY